jgi:polyisoprenoid-binding protein YceI
MTRPPLLTPPSNTVRPERSVAESKGLAVLRPFGIAQDRLRPLRSARTEPRYSRVGSRKWASFVTALLTLLLAAPASAQVSYTVDPEHTFPSFEFSHLGLSTHRGRFNRTSGKILLDWQRKTGKVDISIETASVDTGVDSLDELLRGQEFFDATRNPTVEFRSEQVVFEGERLVGVDGLLTIRGISRPVSLTVTHFKCGLNPAKLRRACGADAEASVRRSEFGMPKFLPFIGDELKLRIQVEALQEP